MRVQHVQPTKESQPVTVYNFEVAENNNYYESNEQILVHNDCKQPSKPKVKATGKKSDGKPIKKTKKEVEQVKKNVDAKNKKVNGSDVPKLPKNYIDEAMKQ